MGKPVVVIKKGNSSIKNANILFNNVKNTYIGNEVFILTETDTPGVYLSEQVDVQTKKITIPNGVTKKYDFKIDINHRHYDLF